MVKGLSIRLNTTIHMIQQHMHSTKQTYKLMLTADSSHDVNANTVDNSHDVRSVNATTVDSSHDVRSVGLEDSKDESSSKLLLCFCTNLRCCCGDADVPLPDRFFTLLLPPSLTLDLLKPEKRPFFVCFSLDPRSFFSSRGEALLEDVAGIDFLRLMKSMLGERLGEGGLTRRCFIPSVLCDLVGGVAGARRVFMELAGETVGVVNGGEAGFASLGEGLCGGVGESCCEEKPESREIRF